MAYPETQIERRPGDLMKWSFVFWVGAAGAIAKLARVLGALDGEAVLRGSKVLLHAITTTEDGTTRPKPGGRGVDRAAERRRAHRPPDGWR
jgi:hypothetical protein